MVDLSKVASNKKILSKIVTLGYVWQSGFQGRWGKKVEKMKIENFLKSFWLGGRVEKMWWCVGVLSPNPPICFLPKIERKQRVCDLLDGQKYLFFFFSFWDTLPLPFPFFFFFSCFLLISWATLGLFFFFFFGTLCLFLFFSFDFLGAWGDSNLFCFFSSFSSLFD